MSEGALQTPKLHFGLSPKTHIDNAAFREKKQKQKKKLKALMS